MWSTTDVSRRNRPNDISSTALYRSYDLNAVSVYPMQRERQ
ncbi:hypothetical protein CKA32_003906 [Geitlerinema sp. FC II]|nr:hypothetical protein CKA32_003906 [Geitlerinema sp. FC II]